MNKKHWLLTICCLVFVLAGCSDNSDKADKTEETQATQQTESATRTPPAQPKQEVSEQAAKPKIDCQLNMGWDPWEPYQYLTPEDEVKGLEIELVSALAREAGCELNFVQQNWMNLLNGIRDGSIDVLGGASKTPARENFAIFSDYYRQEKFVLYVRKGEAANFQGELGALLQGDFKLGVTEDYIYGDDVSALQDNSQYAGKFVTVPTTEVNYYNLLQNNIDGFLEDPFVAAYTIKRKGLKDEIEAHPLEIHSGDVALMFSKESVKPEIVEAFNQSLAKIKSTGEYQKILDKYSF